MNKVSENPLKNRKTFDTPLMVVTSLFVTLYLVSNLMAVKVTSFFGLFYFDAGTITFPFAYMLGDVLTEIWGYKISKKVILITLVCNVLLVVFTTIGIYLPAPEYQQETAVSYEHIFGYVPRIVLASLVGFLMGELSNAYFMVKIKGWTGERFLWVRTIGSSMIGYLFDSVPFVLIAFAGTIPIRDLLLMMLFQYFSKLTIEAVGGTPMAYLAISQLKKFYIRCQ